MYTYKRDALWEDSNKIFNRMSEEDKSYFLNGVDSYDDSEFLVDRIVAYDGKVPIAFVELLDFGDEDMAQICIAVDNEYRHKGIAKKLYNLMEMFYSSEYIYFAWTVHPDNESSIGLALSLNFIRVDDEEFYKRVG